MSSNEHLLKVAVRVPSVINEFFEEVGSRSRISGRIWKEKCDISRAKRILVRIVCRKCSSALPSVFIVFMCNKYSHFLGGRSETTYEFRKNGVDCLNQSRFPGVRHIF